MGNVSGIAPVVDLFNASAPLTTGSASIEPDGFAQFWERYPRKVGKGAARTAYARARKVVTLAVLLEALDRQIEVWTWKQTASDYIPHPKTWLHQERWNDAIEAMAMTTGRVNRTEWVCPHTPHCPHRTACAVVSMREVR